LPVAQRAALHAALGDAQRLAIAERLQLGDASPCELQAELGVPSNLLAHHLAVLEDVGLIERRKSEGDARRRYVRLRWATLEQLRYSELLHADSVLFLCRHNSARSQLATALWRRRSSVPAQSAGTEPARRVDPRMAEAARTLGIELSDPPRGLESVVDEPDLVVSVCDVVREAGDAFPRAHHVHWSVPDPVRSRDKSRVDACARELVRRVERLAPAVLPKKPNMLE